jgi:YbbR domain-containing protein
MKRKIITISFVIAFSILLWAFVTFSGAFSITMNLPVRVINVPENLAISLVSTNEVTVNIKGQGWLLAKQTFGRSPKFYIPSPKKKGLHSVSTIKVLNANQWLSSNLQLDKITPEKIDIKLEKKITKKIKVVPILDLEYSSGYDLVSQIIVQPDSINVTGPKSLLNKVNFIQTIKGKFTDLEKHTTVKLKLEKIPFLSYDKNECNVSFDVQKIVDKTFENIKIGITGVPSRYDVILSPNRITVVLRGGINLLSKLDNEDITSYVKFIQVINDTTGAVEPIINIPNYTSIIDKRPQKIEYIIKKY